MHTKVSHVIFPLAWLGFGLFNPPELLVSISPNTGESCVSCSPFHNSVDPETSIRHDKVLSQEIRIFLHTLRVLSPSAARRIPVWPISRKLSACKVTIVGLRISRRANKHRDWLRKPFTENKNQLQLISEHADRQTGKRLSKEPEIWKHREIQSTELSTICSRINRFYEKSMLNNIRGKQALCAFDSAQP